MKLLSTASLIVALAASPTLADTPPAKAPPAEKKAPPPAKPADKPADKKPTMTPQEAKQVEAFFDDLFAAVVKNKDDCVGMAKGIHGVLDKHAALLEKAATVDKEPPPALKAKFEKKQPDFVNALMKCAQDKDLNVALERLGKATQGKK